MEESSAHLRTSDLVLAGLHDRHLRRQAARGELERLTPGSYIPMHTWKSLSERQRYVTRIRAVVGRLTRPVAISHWSAAAILGLPNVDGWPSRVHVVDPRASKASSSPTMLRRPSRLTPPEVTPWEGLWVTTPSRTAADIALTEPFENAVLVLDHGLREGLFTRAEVRGLLETRATARRLPTALRALDFASGKAEFAGESFSRCGMALRGFVPPALQEPLSDGEGLIGYADFWFEGVGVAGQFDGNWKYSDPRWLRGRSPAEAIIDEKRRQERLAAHPRIRRVVRWGYAVARDPDELARRLTAAGVPRLTGPTRTRYVS
jgi:hypothetical protein